MLKYLLLLITCFVLPLNAQDTTTPPPKAAPLFSEGEQTPPEESRFFEEFIHMLVTLSIIIICILIVSWFLKRLLNTRIQQMNTSSNIKILERRSLTPKSMIYLLEVGGKGFVMAESSNGITSLGEIPQNSPLLTSNKDTSFNEILQEKMKNNES